MIRVQNIINIVSSLSHFGTSQYKCYHGLQEIDMSLFLNAGINVKSAFLPLNKDLDR